MEILITEYQMSVQPIRVQGWPLVEISFLAPANESQVNTWLEQMNNLLLKQQAFGLLTQTDYRSDFSAEGRKAMGLWFRQQREKIGRYCVGLSRIAPDVNAAHRLAGPKMQAAMPCPIFASANPAEARAWIEQRLAEYL